MELLRALFGDKAISDPTSIAQMLARGAVIFFWALLLFRIGKRRMFGRFASYDIVLAIIVGSTLSRTINGQSPFVDTLVVSTLLVALHWVLTLVTSRAPRLARIIRGAPRVLLRDGRCDEDALRRSHLSEEDIYESLRIEVKADDLEKVRLATLERNGVVSFVKKD